MNRPTVRPLQPYSDREILDLVWKHFVTDKAPRCAIQGGHSCIYGKTGCAVGCLLTEQDATAIDRKGFAPISSVQSCHPAIYESYFTAEQLPLLQALQRAHDGDGTSAFNASDKNDGVRMRIAGAVVALRTIRQVF